ncbi:type VI secretion system baseplate subunit TssG [Nannocystis sp. SCPEA4]|uniref:type VI secretion system baseplate subunit TssG n=1 Tax=Nannocystis sp. SCPEA4 TaxID=2996787 RepID=UPI00226E185C|nr:type VI secretion system baseplate subunit TssG [Nannocystis sp. SCPEA4]MCY1060205.1 type VI secretion system baseplate subunit TssG [Nannocystis sp. SCPEA4]
MAAAAEHPTDLSPRPPAALAAELLQQWQLARRIDVWALLAAIDRAGVARELEPDPGRTFHPGEVTAAPGPIGHGLAVRVPFLGLLGLDTPLPDFAVAAIEDAPQLQRLLGAFERRLLAHLHRALRRCAYPAACTPERDDLGSRRLIDLAARGTAARELAPRIWLKLLRHAPGRLRTASGLAAALHCLFAADLGDAAVSIVECVPHAGDLPESELSRIGRASTALGQRFVLGCHAADGDGWFRVRIATLSVTRARPFLRGGDALRRLFAAVAALVGPLLRFDVEIVLAPGAAPRMRLGGPPPRLGVDTWTIHLPRLLSVRHDDPG